MAVVNDDRACCIRACSFVCGRTGIWTKLAPLPVTRDDMAAAGMPGQRLLVMGGETNQGTARSQVQRLSWPWPPSCCLYHPHHMPAGALSLC